MHQHKIPHGQRCGIFSTLSWWPLILSVSWAGQALPRLAIPPPASHASAGLAMPTDNITILALRVAFALDDNVSTTGDGHFLTTVETAFCDGFLVDKPPHDVPYFEDQLLAVANYFEQVSRGQVTFNLPGSLVYPPGGEPIVLDRSMASYRPVADDDSSDGLLVQLLAESLAGATKAGVDPMAYDMVVVFHAGLGQDFTYPGLDPTPLDIPSAFIDGDMIRAALDTTGIPLPDGSLFTHPGILLPESQNHIFYDVAEDIFFGQQDLCDVQVGLTGTFALLMGFAFGYPPLFDTQAGETGVGVFGLMDIGSNNGQGVIPAPPTAWTRLRLGWESSVELEGDITLAARHLGEGRIGRISLSTDEYLLVENRLNWVLPGVDMDSLRFRNALESDGGFGLTLPHYFDYLVDSTGVDTATSGVITTVPNYDMGLPGSGLLIWHVDDSRIGPTAGGINNDRNARAVALVEADGAVDIGFPTTALINDPVQGWRWDLWYAGNEAFFVANPDRRANNPLGLLSLDYDTFPSTALNSGAASGVALVNIGPAGPMLNLTVEDEVNVTRLPEGSRLLGYNGQDYIYALGDSLWLGHQPVAALSDSILPIIISEHDAVLNPGEGFWGLTLKNPGYLAQRFLPGGSLEFSLADTVQLA
ncbi:MAG: hypothetical protein IIB42_10640, partial [Candidatus Marinimicrobia bacterium]|nr:hypothetical protein [Candidatus Neomarinimicrobiota bacterium]